MTTAFLKAKHWQLFTATWGLLIFLQVLIIAASLISLSNLNVNPFYLLKYLTLLPLFFLWFLFVSFGWQWSVAVGLQKLVPAGVKMKLKKFKIFFFVPMAYLCLLLLYCSYVYFHLSQSATAPHRTGAIIGGGYYSVLLPLIVIIPLHLFSMFCLFYCLYFVAKTFKTVEMRREVSFSDFAGEFFLVWFFPIGVWILQPKINKMALNTGNP